MRANRDSTESNEGPAAEGVSSEALKLMERALSLLDGNEGPEDAGAHLDLAIHRLKAWIAEKQIR